MTTTPNTYTNTSSQKHDIESILMGAEYKMEEKLKDSVRPLSINQRILRDARAIQVELELVKVHCIELEKVLMILIVDEENRQHK